MKYLAMLATAAVVLLSGCATTIRSDVTAFNAWPADIQDKSYAFEAPQGADDTLEYRSYQVLVGNELGKLGFHQVADNQQPKLLVGMKFSTIDHPVRVLEADDPFMGPYWGPGYGRYGWGYSRWGYRPFFYDPYRFGPTYVEERVKHEYQRQLRVTINSIDGRKLYDVTVQNTSRVQATPHVMPALVQSAFTGFPGVSGVPRRVDLTIEPKTETVQAAPAKAG
ncbi:MULTISPECIES: DUF4136 domain-containing protein [unclassified Duganella]|uniref:DUF4136 domain-containing protein n=1 Tax=unclassified Duganella TaxID=2636909 RepID=UPI000E3490B9|nr:MULTISPECIES: DUF4136 domain-containing protein [unclassified Duganella]RFP11870.1 DUF4136 domain-containing protein [Duganella sp. BJB475]RFP31436.1 DUF4136 domain-containing protein [Duganella sp. BJB476]